MTTATIAVPVSDEQQTPKLLLDTNVYLDLADGTLGDDVGRRLARIAAHRDPPLLWACGVTFDELVCHLPDGPATFPLYRTALRWVELLCKGRGMAEPTDWVRRCGVFTRIVPDDGLLGAKLVGVRRNILKANSYEDIAPEIRSTIDLVKTSYKRRIDDWVEGRTTVGDVARAQVGKQGLRYADVAADQILTVSRETCASEVATSGPVRTDEDQRHVQRELIAFEVSLLRKAQNPAGYNHAKRRSDYNDYWLCAYPAAGYTIVTREKRLRDALKQGECVEPRMMGLEEGITLAEKWLAGRP
jgi:hypothetical protein